MRGCSALAIVALASLAWACEQGEPTAPAPAIAELPREERTAEPSPAEVVCQNDEIPAFDAILVVVPHPDDETLGFAGPIYEAAQAGRRVRVVVVTDGQAYCGACNVWKNGAPRDEVAEPCTLRELVVFGHVRRRETLAAMELLGVAPGDVEFLGYVDGSLKTAWEDPERPPALPICVEDGTPPNDWLAKTGEHLAADLRRILREEEDAQVVFTTDPRDTHPDHATLYAFVTRAIRENGAARELFTALIHRTGPGPSPCLQSGTYGGGCALPRRNERDTDATPFSQIRELSYTPATVWDAREEIYGPALRFCLAPALYEGPEPLKRRAIERYETQIGVRDRFGTPLPPAYQGWVDWSGWLLRFVRRDELLYRSAESAAFDVGPPGFEPGT